MIDVPVYIQKKIVNLKDLPFDIIAEKTDIDKKLVKQILVDYYYNKGYGYYGIGQELKIDRRTAKSILKQIEKEKEK